MQVNSPFVLIFHEVKRDARKYSTECENSHIGFLFDSARMAAVGGTGLSISAMSNVASGSG